MKLLLALLLAVSVGCSTIAKRAEEARVASQKILDAVLSPSFTGDTYFSTANSYVNVGVTIRAGGLRRTANGWEWNWLVYSGNSPISRTVFVFGSPPQTLLP